MFDIDKVPWKRRIIACIILSLPVLYYVSKEPKYNSSFVTSILYMALGIIGFVLLCATLAGIISFIFLLVYMLVLGIGRLLLGIKPESFLEGLSSVGYISIGIALILLYYIIFAGHLPKIIL